MVHVSLTPAIRQAVQRALELNNSTDEDDVVVALDFAPSATTLPLADVRRAVVALQQRDKSRVWRLRDVLRDAPLQVPRAPPPPRSAEFEAHLARLRDERDEREYRRIVGDVDLRSIVSAEEETRTSLKNTSTQLSLGLNMAISAVTVFVAIFWAGRQSYGSESHWPWITGLMGAIFILLVETVLFIVRASRIEYPSGSSSSSSKHVIN